MKMKSINVKKKKEEYVIKKVGWTKIARYVFWILLFYFFARGVAITLRPDNTEVVTNMISKFREDFSNYKDQNEEIMSFAQNFAKEYLTYKNREEEDYKQRILKYVSKDFYNQSDIVDFRGTAEAIYVQAYRKEQYSQDQYDVYVKASVNYSIQVPSEQGDTFETKNIQKDVILKVPIYTNGSEYIVEDIPMYVNDTIKYEQYEAKKYSGDSVSDDAVVTNVKNALSSFFKAYYEQNQNEINYYLTKDADLTKFIGLDGRLKFETIDSINCYQTAGTEDILCITKVLTRDSVNEVAIYQQFNIIVQKINNKYYVKDLNTKTINIQTKEQYQEGYDENN